MTAPTSVITAEQALEYREALAAFEREQAYQAALARHAVYLVIKPLVDSAAFIALHEAVTDLRANGPKDDSYFGIGLEAIYQGMTSLGIQVANWAEPTAPVPSIAPDTDAAE